ncbi:beta-defensin 130B [Phascolarctos cinereus]|uniref:Beta-defensin 130-like n=1 Tax=Phascolarctos cinereus TaxID=38626 RepID=A0A6P5KI95_PHACI|nr:beta-defensin 130-like [Phascolarctos cinereus]
MRIVFLFSVLLLFVSLIPSTSISMYHGSRLCAQLQGVCRKDICDTIEERIGRCTTHKSCCRKWWLSSFMRTPEPM